MTNDDLELLTPAERGVWAQLGRMQPEDVALAVERELVGAIVDRKARAFASIDIVRIMKAVS